MSKWNTAKRKKEITNKWITNNFLHTLLSAAAGVDEDVAAWCLIADWDCTLLFINIPGVPVVLEVAPTDLRLYFTTVNAMLLFVGVSSYAQ